jgi:hypothetical protein
VTGTDRGSTSGVVLSLARRAISFELGMWRSLYRWIARRPVAPPGAKAFGYSAEKTPILWAFIALNAIEIPAFHLLLPWPTVRRIVDVLGAYSFVWMLGLLASIRVHPHVVGDSGLRIRSGFSIEHLTTHRSVGGDHDALA